MTSNTDTIKIKVEFNDFINDWSEQFMSPEQRRIEHIKEFFRYHGIQFDGDFHLIKDIELEMTKEQYDKYKSREN